MKRTVWAAGVALVVVVAAGAIWFAVANDGKRQSAGDGSGRSNVQIAQQNRGPAAPGASPGQAAQAPQPVGEVFGKWSTVCVQAAQGELYCRAQHVVFNEAQRPELSLVVRPSRQSGQLPIATVTPPWGVLIARGIDLQIDTTSPVRVPIRICLPGGCVADFSVVETFMTQMQHGTTLKVIMAAATGQPISIDVPLAGFDQAYNRAVEREKEKK